MSEKSDIRCSILYEVLLVYITLWKQCLGYNDQNFCDYRWGDIDIVIVYVEYSSKLWWQPKHLWVKITFVCSKSKEMLILLYWPAERTNPVTSHIVVLQDGGALAPKAIIKHPFFFLNGYINRVCYICFLIKVEISLLNNVNLTDCFTCTLMPDL